MFDWLLGPREDRDSAAAMRDLLVGFLWLSLIPGALIAPIYPLVQGEWDALLMLLLGDIPLVIAGVALRRGQRTLAGHLLSVATLAPVVGLAVIRDPLVLPGLALPVLVAVATLGPRGVAAWTAVSVSLAVGLGSWHLGSGGADPAWTHVVSVTSVVAVALSLSVGTLGFGVQQLFHRSVRNMVSSQAETDAIFDRAGVGLLLVGSDGRIQRANPAARSLLGPVEGLAARAVLPTDSVVREGRALVAERAPFDESRQIVAVTDRTDAEEQSRLLQKARDAAVEASEAKSRFLANMSHELRTPLNAIIGYAEMLSEVLEDHGDLESMRDAAAIRASGRHLLGVIDDVLDLARVETGQLDLRAEPVDFGTIVEEVVESFRPAVKSGVELSLEVDDLDPVLADGQRLRQILSNLLSNAVKFTRRGYVTVCVSERTDGIEIVVADTGIGMDEHALEGLFERFTRHVEVHVDGVGLGMAIVHELVTAMRGTIHVQSVLGTGTTFRVHLPLVPAVSRSAG